MGALKDAMALDGALRVLVVHGFTDLVTPYFTSKLLIDQMPVYGSADRLKLSVYPAGTCSTRGPTREKRSTKTPPTSLRARCEAGPTAARGEGARRTARGRRREIFCEFFRARRAFRLHGDGAGGAPSAPPLPSAVLPKAPAAFAGPVLDAGGACTGPAPGTAAAIEPGIGECDLVRLKGRPPTDVLIGEGARAREVQVLYAEPGAKELYFFVNNRLDRIVR